MFASIFSHFFLTLYVIVQRTMVQVFTFEKTISCKPKKLFLFFCCLPKFLRLETFLSNVSYWIFLLERKILSVFVT